jgi:immune inhibitor A
MRKSRVVAAATVSVLGAALAVPLSVPQAGAAPGAPAAPAAAPDADRGGGSDNLLRPWERKYEAVRQAALEQRLRSGGQGEVERLGGDTYARVEQSGRDKIFVVLAEFGGVEHSEYPDGESDAVRVNGPRHNQIPRPDRDRDNSTLWQRDYDYAHYEHMYFDRMRRYFEHQSMGRYTVGGQVTEWVRVPFNQARYGRDYCGDIVCPTTWSLVRDGLAYWVEQQLASGRTLAQIRRHLRTFDHEDRYDFDEDGNFEEPDGYVDHFQIVHAGGDQAAGDPVYGTDAIWSHKWFAQIQPFGTGPTGGAQLGGVNVGEGEVTDPTGADVQIPDNPTGVWVGNYTIQPENGGLGVFAHEFAHDLGLPDLYDTSGNTGGAENSTAFWSLMSSGANIGRPSQPGIGDAPVDLGAYEKFQLGWLDYDVERAGRISTHRLRALSATGNRDNGLIVLLPDKQVPLELGDPCDGCGERFFYSGQGNDLNNTMSLAVAAGGPLTAQVRYEIEEGFDYAFLESSSDGGATWEPVDTNLSAGDAGFEEGITGSSGGEWVELTATVPAGADAVRFRYTTDETVAESGFQVDQIVLAGTPIGTAEEPEGWELDGFQTTTGAEDQKFLNAYIVANRQYVNYDRSLASAYNFGFAARPDLVEFYPYQDGMLVDYWDTSYEDNNVGDHPGHGLVLPVDAHPNFAHYPDGTLARPRIQSYDSTFGLEPTARLRLHYLGVPFQVRSRPAQPIFNDLLDWWYAGDEHGTPHPGRYQPGWVGVDVPKTGTTIRVVKINHNGVMTVRVGRTR